jgi:N,N'-diacetylchitobiose transport system permease protein
MPVRRRSRLPHILITPTIIVLIAALGYPVAWQIITSFKEFGLRQQFGVPADWVGLANYVEIVSDPALWAIVLRSLVFCLVVSFATVLIGGALAGLMNSVHKAARLTLQVALLLAWAMPAVASMTVWIWLVDWRRGLLNWALVRLGVDAQGHNWLADPTSFLIIAAIIVTWMSVPFVTLSIYAGLTQVSPEVFEAAKIDGASGIQRLRAHHRAPHRSGVVHRPAAAVHLEPARFHPGQDLAGRRRRGERDPSAGHLHLPTRHGQGRFRLRQRRQHPHVVTDHRHQLALRAQR